jgi:protein involved in polysaccharide export with SLBB domain
VAKGSSPKISSRRNIFKQRDLHRSTNDVGARHTNRWVKGLVWLMVAVPCLTGCAAMHPLQGVSSDEMPPEFKLPTRSIRNTIDLSLLRRTPPADYLLDTGDVLGVFVEGILGRHEDVPPVYAPTAVNRPPAVGYPIRVRNDGTIALPQVGRIPVRGLTIEGAEDAVRLAYTTGSRPPLQQGHERVFVSLQQPRTYRVLVIRQESGNLQGNLGASATVNFEIDKRGTGRVVHLPAYQNDVLHALAQTGGLPGLDAENVIYVIRRHQFERSNPPPFSDEPLVPLPEDDQHDEAPQSTAAWERPSYIQQTAATVENNFPGHAVHQRQPPLPHWNRQANGQPQYPGLQQRGWSGGFGWGRYGSPGPGAMPAYDPDRSMVEFIRGQWLPTTPPHRSSGAPASGASAWSAPSAGASRRYPGPVRYSTFNAATSIPAPADDEVSRSSNGLPPGRPNAVQGALSAEPSVASGTYKAPQQVQTENPSASALEPISVEPTTYGQARDQDLESNSPLKHELESRLIRVNPDQEQNSAPSDSAAVVPDNALTVDWPEVEYVEDMTVNNPRIVRIPIQIAPGEMPPMSEEDITLYDGDIVFVEARIKEFFFTAGLLGSGQYILPRDYDLDVLGAIAFAEQERRLNYPTRTAAGISVLNQDVTVGASKVIIHRKLADGCRIPIEVDLYDAMDNPNDRLLIQPEDRIFLRYTRKEACWAFIERHLFEATAIGLGSSWTFNN